MDSLQHVIDNGPSPALASEARVWLRKCQAELDAETAELAEPAPEKAASAGPSKPALAPPGLLVKRFDWFQTPETVVITLFTKGAPNPLPPGAIELRQESLSGAEVDVLQCVFSHSPPGSDSPREFSLRLVLQGRVSGAPIVHVGRMNIEVTLRKASPSSWDDLQHPEAPHAPMGLSSAPAASSAPSTVVPRRPEDWGQMAKSLESEEAAPEGDDALQALFRQIYANSSDEVKRAMNKSFQQSGGTVLSTNWNEVAGTDYSKDRKAPDGMEWKKTG
jgi:hypothetical protein